ncbi:MAG: hypothetical protein AAF511_08570 [Pseudomonadota bacterium]
MFKKCLVAIIAIITGSVASAGAAEITADFESGSEGFSLSNGFLNRISTGGNPGGNLLLVDSDNFASDMLLTLGNQFNVPLSIGDTLSFDALELQSSGGNSASFGRVTITGGGQSLTEDFFSVDLTSNWTTVLVSFDIVSWNTTEAVLSGILSSLESIVINVDSGSQDNEQVRIDNVVLSITEVPIPAAVWLFVPMVGIAFLRRRGGANQ